MMCELRPGLGQATPDFGLIGRLFLEIDTEGILAISAVARMRRKEWSPVTD
jgi:hypothetical protein